MSIFDDHPNSAGSSQPTAASNPTVADAHVVEPAASVTVPAVVTVSPANPLSLSLEQFRAVLPDKVKKSLNQQLVDQINATLSNPGEFEHYRDNLLSYTRVMQDGKFKIEQYLDAVKYVSHKLMGSSNIEAYMKTFPDKYQGFVAAGVSPKDIASYVSAYNKGKLVNLIFEQTLIPVHVLNQDMYQRALNAQFELGLSAQSEKVRADALNSVLTQLRPPEVKKIEMDIAVKENDAIKALRETTMELAEAQRKAIASGAINAQHAAEQRLVIEMGEAEIVGGKE